jgi:hypothetical protein
MATGMVGVAFEDPLYREKKRLKKRLFSKGFKSIVGTAWIKPAAAANTRPQKQLVEPY